MIGYNKQIDNIVYLILVLYRKYKFINEAIVALTLAHRLII